MDTGQDKSAEGALEEEKPMLLQHSLTLSNTFYTDKKEEKC